MDFFRLIFYCIVFSALTCMVSSETLLFRSVSSQSADKTLPNIVCPDPKYQCSSNTTCCLKTSGDYGCCPFKKVLELLTLCICEAPCQI